MKVLIKSLLLLLFSLNCFSQNDSTVLVIPLNFDKIEFDSKVQNMLNYNKIPIDSAKNFISKLSYSTLTKYYPNYTFQNIKNINQEEIITDSLKFVYQWNSTQYKRITNSNGITKYFYSSYDRNVYQYYGCLLSGKDSIDLMKLLKNHNYKYIFIIDKFETIIKRPFLNNPIISLHLEIFDNNLNKVFGDKYVWSPDITPTMYYNIFKSYVQQTFDNFFKHDKSNLKNYHEK